MMNYALKIFGKIFESVRVDLWSHASLLLREKNTQNTERFGEQ